MPREEVGAPLGFVNQDFTAPVSNRFPGERLNTQGELRR